MIFELNLKRGITPGTALRLAKYFGASEDFWLNIQLRWDLFRAREKEIGKINRIRPYELNRHIEECV
jgi:antitoxin HigA-1